MAGLVAAPALGADPQPVLTADINPGPASSLSFFQINQGAVNAVGSTAYFEALDGTGNYRLWKSNAVRTVPVEDAGSDAPNPAGDFYFSADGGGLWRTDGTPQGTRLLTADVQPSDITVAGDAVFFSGCDDTHGCELWKSDGTTAGTVMVKDLNPDTHTDEYGTWSESSDPRQLTAIGGTVYFGAQTSDGWGLWKSDGTADGTARVSEDDVFVDQMTAVGNTLYFGGEDESHGNELWKSDGTAAGTVMVKDIIPGTYTYLGNVRPNESNPHGLSALGSTLYFSAQGPEGQRTLWRSDGTTAGTYSVTDKVRNDRNMTAVGNRLYFAGDDGVHGTELWASDGTAAGTVQIADLSLASDGSLPRDLTAAGSTLFFSANDGVHGRELWALDLSATPGPPGNPGVPDTPAVNPACAPATTASANAAAVVTKAKAKLKKAKKAHNAAQIKKAKAKLKKAKKAAAVAAANQSASCA